MYSRFGVAIHYPTSGKGWNEDHNNTVYINEKQIGNEAYGYYDWQIPDEGEEGYIIAKHEGELIQD